MDRNGREESDSDSDSESSTWWWGAAGAVGAVVAGAALLYKYNQSGQSQEQTSNTARRSADSESSRDRNPSTSPLIAQVAGAATTGALLYNYFQNSKKDRQTPNARSVPSASEACRRETSPTSANSETNFPRIMECLSRAMGDMAVNSRQPGGGRGVPRASIPANPSITSLNALLNDIYLRYIALNDVDFENYYNVVHKIFLDIHNKMKEVDPYYQKYSSTVRFAGSHPDRLRINKPDEFDIDIVIGLPLSIKTNPLNPGESDFILEPKDPGFVQLKMGVQYQRLYARDGCDWHINKTAYQWKDDKNYLLRSNFSDWFKSVVNRALDTFKPNRSADPQFRVDGIVYNVRKSESGPAMTIFVENKSIGFKLDVDLVPALRFPISRWSEMPSSYRRIPPECLGRDNDYWMVVPKPNKGGQNDHDKKRSWRIAMHEQEKMLMYDNNHMKQAIRLMKKLRDAQNMEKIASYYIKTLFFWEAYDRIERGDRTFWNKDPACIFKVMLKNFHQALVAGQIKYFWNKRNNLIGQVDKGILTGYAKTVGKLVDLLESPARNYKEIAGFFLTAEEYQEYNVILSRI